MNCSFEVMTNLQYKLKALTAEIRSFQPGEKYIKMQKEHQNEVAHLTHENKELTKSLNWQRREPSKQRRNWMMQLKKLRNSESISMRLKPL